MAKAGDSSEVQLVDAAAARRRRRFLGQRHVARKLARSEPDGEHWRDHQGQGGGANAPGGRPGAVFGGHSARKPGGGAARAGERQAAVRRFAHLDGRAFRRRARRPGGTHEILVSFLVQFFTLFPKVYSVFSVVSDKYPYWPCAELCYTLYGTRVRVIGSPGGVILYTYTYTIYLYYILILYTYTIYTYTIYLYLYYLLILYTYT